MTRSEHDIESWQRALLRLPDEVFFDIMRNYLGELKTPFNKHSLIEELSSFLRNAETQQRLIQQIDETDAQVLTSVRLLGNPSLDRLFEFFSGTLTYLELHYLLLNLQERLLVYIDQDGRTQRLFLTPLLDELLTGRVIDPELLFPSVDAKGAAEPEPWPPESLLLALYSFLSGTPDLFKADGSLKKRASEEVLSALPQLAPAEKPPAGFRELIEALTRLGLVANERGVVHPVRGAWESFAELEPLQRRAIVWSSLIGRASRRAIEHRASMLIGLIENLPEGRALAPLALERLLNLGPGASRAEGEHSSDSIVDALERLGVLVRPAQTPEGEWYALNGRVRSVPEEEPRAVMIEANFQLTLKPSVGLSDGLKVASMAEIRRFDIYPHYEITKRSFVRALEHGASAEGLIAHLESLGGGALPQNIRFSLLSWDKEFRGIGLYRGVVLTADAERRHLIEHSEAMKPWIRATLAPGVYLLDERGSVEWTRALTRSGIDLIPSVQDLSAEPGQTGPDPFAPLPRPANMIRHGRSVPADATSEDGPELREELQAHLETLDLPADLVGELQARIAKKLILFPRQLSQSQPRLEKNEAKGLDYVGKVRLVEQALRSGSDLLEILERTPKGATRRLLVRPSEVQKSANDLILHARTLPENEAVQIRIRKIGLVRKLKSSLYAP